jgi:shikimate dehydrogenase
LTDPIPGKITPQVITGKTKVFALIGHPVQHSLSPQLHCQLLAHCGLDGTYVALDVNPASADKVASSIRTLGLTGINLTVPFKEKILPDLDELTLAAREAGAVNVVINLDGHLTGYNTDGEGFLGAIHEEHNFVPQNKKCILLGAGGAARAIAASLAAGGARQIVLLNRTLSRANTAANSLKKGLPNCDFQTGVLSSDDFARWSPDADLIVNALSGSANDTVSALSVATLCSRAIWADINYWMTAPPQIQACKNRGLRVSTGLGMLVHQGALSFELFTGYPVPVALLHEILSSSPLQQDPNPVDLG